MVGQSLTLVDGHVHYHPCFDPSLFMRGAVNNFARAAQQLDVEQWTGCLLLANGPRHDSLQLLREARQGQRLPDWQFAPTDEPHTWWARRADGVEIALIAGRQILCRERLEVLVLGCASPQVDDGMPFRQTLQEAMACDGIPVVPWGFGKWWFSRGVLVCDVMKKHRKDIFLGDNMGRPSGGPLPRQFVQAREDGIRLLPGTDPLPFPAQAQHAGRYGFLMPETIDRLQPAEHLKGWLRLGSQPQSYGRRDTIPQFCQHQIALRWRKMCHRMSA